MTARSSRIGLRMLDAALWPLRRMRLGPLQYAGPSARVRDDLPILIVANHVSWWDGFLVREVHERMRPRQPFCVVMTDRELGRHPWLRSLGAVGIRQGSVAGVRQAFRAVAARRRRDTRSFFVYFPQGVIRPSWCRPLEFRRGVERLVRILAPVTVIALAIHIEPLNRAVPTPFVVAGEPRVLGEDGRLDAATLEAAVTRELDALLDFIGLHGESAIDAWQAWRPHSQVRAGLV